MVAGSSHKSHSVYDGHSDGLDSRGGSATPRRGDSSFSPEGKSIKSFASSQQLSASSDAESYFEEGKGSLVAGGPIEFVNTILDAHGGKFICQLMAIQHGIKGFARTVVDMSIFFLFQDQLVNARRLQVLKGIILAPWVLKPVIALLSDSYPIFGYHKSPYMVISLFVGLAGAFTVGFHNSATGDIGSLVYALTGLQFAIACTDLLTEAAYSKKIAANPKQGPNIITFVWLFMGIFSLVGVAVVAFCLKMYNPQACFLAIVGPLALAIIPTMNNFLGEERATDVSLARTQSNIAQSWPLVFLCGILVVMSFCLTFIGLYVNSPHATFIVSNVFMVGLLIFNGLFFSPMISKVNAFFLIQSSLFISIDSATNYFYTDFDNSYPEGPHFSRVFVTLWLGSIAIVAGLVALLIYNRYMRNWNYQWLMISASILWVCVSISDTLFFLRVNRMLGISDYAFVLSTAAAKSVIWSWAWLPGVVLMSQLCPPGLEATMFALLAGFHNCGNSFAEFNGAWVLHMLQVTPTNEPGDSAKFKYLWVASLISSVMPIITVALIPYLIPNRRQTDKIAGAAHSPTQDSWWERYTSRRHHRPNESTEDAVYGTFIDHSNAQIRNPQEC